MIKLFFQPDFFSINSNNNNNNNNTNNNNNRIYNKILNRDWVSARLFAT